MGEVPPWRTAALTHIPPERLGRFLGAARRVRGETLAEVAVRLDYAFTPTVLAMIERGGYRVPPEDVVRLFDGYGADLDDVVPHREPMRVDLGAGLLRVGRHVATIDERLSVDDVLVRYLAFVRELRRIAPDGPIASSSLRDEDMEALGEALGLSADIVEGRLIGILDPTSRQAREAIVRAGRERSAFGARLAEAAARRSAEGVEA